MRRFSDAVGFVAARASTLFTLSALEASDEHDRLAKAVGLQLARWVAVDEARRGAEDGVTRCNARIAWCDYRLDRAVKRLGNEVLRDAGGDASNKLFKEMFPEPPSAVIKLGLEAEIARCEAFAPVVAKRKLSKAAAAAYADVLAAMDAGTRALAARRAAYAKSAEASLDVASWKEATDAARQSVYVQLQSWAIEHGEDRSYADRFFPENPRERKAPAAGPDGKGEGDPKNG